MINHEKGEVLKTSRAVCYVQIITSLNRNVAFK